MKITEFIPSRNINLNLKLNLPSSLALADPNLGQSHKIDILLSSSFLFEISESDKYIADNLIFQNFKFGYIGNFCIEGNFNHNFCRHFCYTNGYK